MYGNEEEDEEEADTTGSGSGVAGIIGTFSLPKGTSVVRAGVFTGAMRTSSEPYATTDIRCAATAENGVTTVSTPRSTKKKRCIICIVQHQRSTYTTGMKNLFLTTMSLVLLAGCSSLTGSVEPPADTNTSENTSTSENAEPTAIHTAINVLGTSLNLPKESIVLMSYEVLEWPDTCLGLGQEGAECEEKVVPGYRIVLKTDTGFTYIFRTDMEATVLYTEPNVEQ